MKSKSKYIIQKIFVLLLIILVFSNCNKIFHNDEFTQELQTYTGDELKINGFYIEKSPSPYEAHWLRIFIF